MKPVLLAAALALPVLLTGCAGTGYYSDYGPGYPVYYDGYDYGGGPYIGFYSYDRSYYHHGYNHYDGGGYRHGSVAYHGSSHVSGGRSVASVSHASGHSGGGSHASASMGRH